MSYIFYSILFIAVFLACYYSKIKNKLIIWHWMRRLSIKKHAAVFDELYKNVDGFALSKISREKSDAPEYTYGEILFMPFIAILSQVNINKDTVFYDLGSGTGKAVLACNMVFHLKKSCGVELFANLYNSANAQKIKLGKYPEYNSNKIHFINDNFLNIELRDATLIFINATAFIGDTWDRLNDKLENLTAPVTIISTSKKISAKNFSLINNTYAEMSWGVVMVYFYESFANPKLT